MDKTYQPADIEQRWYEQWENAGYFAPNSQTDSDTGTGKPYSIAIPPPNVTGSLHMGHAFQHSIMDCLIRYHRMRGDNTLWQVGTDHAGIATQMVVERQLAAKGQTRHQLGRDAFIDKVWDWKDESGGTITRQMRRLGNSVDWDTERFTMDDGFYKAVQEAFIKLHEEGLIYRGKRLVNWDPKLHTAISDLEVENPEKDGSLWHLRFPLADGATTSERADHLVVATTRPETMLGDTAVAVNPADDRYKDLVGKFVDLPLTGRRIPIIADDHVDREFGSGCVKVTPAHDFNDYAIGLRHALPMINVLDENAAVLASAEIYNSDGSANTELDTSLPKAYAGLDRYAARKTMIKDLDDAGLLEKTEPHKLKVPTGDRSGLVIEPRLTDQWFVDAKKLAGPAVQAVKDGDIRFVPKQYENMYFSWMNDIQDWCISRQLWWGHRIPAWYDDEGNIYVGRSEADVRAANNLGDVALKQDDDVLDTWFSSGLWTFATQGWPDKTERLECFHPTDVLVTGFDIIFFWVARMIMMSLKLTGEVPFKEVYVTGLIRDESGQKMSKSKGNVLDPLDMIDGIDAEALVNKRTANMMQPEMAAKIAKRTQEAFPEGIAPHGTDALRFTLFSLASTGRDINWDMKRLEGYRNFCNKLWNAARYVLMNTEGENCAEGGTLSLADRWIISQLQRTEESVTKHLDNYRFDLASQAVYEFAWNEYCDWYLELSKPVLWNKDTDPLQQQGTRATLLRVLEALLRLAHPFIPYITEEIWQRVVPVIAANSDSYQQTIMTARWPVPQPSKLDENAEADVAWLKRCIVAIRNIRGEMNIGPGKPIPLLLRAGNETDKVRSEAHGSLLTQLAKLDSMRWLTGGEAAPACSTQLAGDLELLVPIEGLIDVSAEIARLDKTLGKLDADIARLEKKLSNAKFVDNAPAEVVAAEKTKLAGQQQSAEKLREQRRTLASLN